MDVARMKRGISSNMSEVEQIRPKKMPCRAPPMIKMGAPSIGERI